MIVPAPSIPHMRRSISTCTWALPRSRSAFDTFPGKERGNSGQYESLLAASPILTRTWYVGGTASAAKDSETIRVPIANPASHMPTSIDLRILDRIASVWAMKLAPAGSPLSEYSVSQGRISVRHRFPPPSITVFGWTREAITNTTVDRINKMIELNPHTLVQ